MSGDTLSHANIFALNRTLSKKKNNDGSLIDSSKLFFQNVLLINSSNITKTSSFVYKKRIDAYGNEITKSKNKQFHVTFIDKLDDNRKKKLVKVIHVPSYKKYNYKVNNNAFDFDTEGAACCNAPCVIF